MNAPFTTPIRTAPHNIEAEQALLGAILVNNEAFYRASDFLEPEHFFEPIHQRIYELVAGLIRANKVATRVTLKTFLPGDTDIAGLSVNQYLARLAAEATTIINAEDYGRTIYDLSIRRGLITIGEDMVNLAYDAPVDATPLSQIEDVERQLYKLAESGRNDTGFQRFGQALAEAVDMAGRASLRDGKLSGTATGLPDLDASMGGLQPSDLIILAGRPGIGKTALATNIAFNVAKAWRGEMRADGHMATLDGGIVGFFSLEMSAEQLADPHHRRANRGFQPIKSAVLISRREIMKRSNRYRRNCRTCRFMSTKPVVCRLANWRHGPDVSSVSAGLTFW